MKCTDLADTPPMSEITEPIRACRQHTQNATSLHPATGSTTMPCYRNSSSGMSRKRATERMCVYCNHDYTNSIAITALLLAAPTGATASSCFIYPSSGTYGYRSFVRFLFSSSLLTSAKIYENHHNRNYNSSNYPIPVN